MRLQARALACMAFVWLIGCAGPARQEDEPGSRFKVETGVDAMSASDRPSLSDQVWGLQPTDQLPPVESTISAAEARVGADSQAGEQDTRSAGSGSGASTGANQGGQDAQDGQDKQDLSPQDMASIRARFGSNVIINQKTGEVTKQYFLSGEAGLVFLNLIAEPGGTRPDATKLEHMQTLGGDAKSKSVLGRMVGDNQVELIVIKNFEQPEGVAIKTAVSGQLPPQIPIGSGQDLVLVTAKVGGLAAFENALNLFFANIPQVEIEVKVVEYSTTDTLSFGIIPTNANTPSLNQLKPDRLIKNITSQFPLAAPLVGGTSIGDRGIITLGGIHDSWDLNATLQLLEANSIADVLSSPKMVVRNGGVASVNTTSEIPYPKAKITSSGQNITADISFKPVGITLNIRPVIAGTDTVILQVYAKVSSVTGFAATSPVQTPIISTREAVTSVHVTNGKTTVIGGLKTKTQFDQEQKIPILGDIPILGYLFRSTSTQTAETTLEFHITPRIIQGSQGFSAGPIGG